MKLIRGFVKTAAVNMIVAKVVSEARKPKNQKKFKKLAKQLAKKR
jgi:rRNA pseudouridine-1189 N-methylase Emg1 (Nep1/Mra1 family)